MRDRIKETDNAERGDAPRYDGNGNRPSRAVYELRGNTDDNPRRSEAEERTDDWEVVSGRIGENKRGPQQQKAEQRRVDRRDDAHDPRYPVSRDCRECDPFEKEVKAWREPHGSKNDCCRDDDLNND